MVSGFAYDVMMIRSTTCSLVWLVTNVSSWGPTVFMCTITRLNDFKLSIVPDENIEVLSLKLSAHASMLW
jgi:hypothetical protein